MAAVLHRGEMTSRIREGLRVLGGDCTSGDMRTWMKQKYGTGDFNETTFYNLRGQHRNELKMNPPKADPPPKPADKPIPAKPVEKEEVKTPNVGGEARQQEASKPERQETDVATDRGTAIPSDTNGKVTPTPVPAVENNSEQDSDLIKAGDVVEILPQLRQILSRVGNRKGVVKTLLDAL